MLTIQEGAFPMTRLFLPALALASGVALAPSAALACACGCSIFDVGTNTLLPGGPGGVAYFQYSSLRQTKNWHGTSRAPAADNDDKRITSDFHLAGFQYMFNDDWGAMVELPYTHRALTAADSGPVETSEHSSLGDIRVMGVYSGFEPDMSFGIIFGVKLATGDHDFRGFDTDVQIGSGSTDVLLGFYKTGAFVPDQSWTWFVQALWQHEVATQDGYTPGSELNGAAGVSYTPWKVGNVGIAPIAQIVVSYRGRDGGREGDPDSTGYTRVLFAPGVAIQIDAVKLYGDIEVPVYQDIHGDQLIAPVAYKLVASYGF